MCPNDESMMNATGSPTSEVWLRGNVRPVLVVAAVGGLAAIALLATLFLTAAPPTAWWLAIACCLVIAAVIGTLAFAAAQPRLVHEGDAVTVRLAPGRVHAVPLAAIECFFMGSSRLEAEEKYRDDAISHRVGTLVMRVAERAADWQARPTFVPWGTWSDGAIVFDGRWCAPLSVELARQLSGKLVAAKRAAAARAAGSPEHLP